jgi:uncharacterized protein YndB with AHSA1/START domain
MEVINKTLMTVQTIVNAPVETVWESWTNPSDIIKWNHASDDWHSPRAENDLRVGGKFVARMEAKDGSNGFDFGGIYTMIKPYKLIEYTIGDGRKVKVNFKSDGDSTRIIELFEAEGTHTIEEQIIGWQAILDNFKKFTESKVSVK